MLQAAKKPVLVSRDLPEPAGAPDDGAWLQAFRHHLGRLYEPSTDLPSDLDQLVNAVARRLDR